MEAPVQVTALDGALDPFFQEITGAERYGFHQDQSHADNGALNAYVTPCAGKPSTNARRTELRQAPSACIIVRLTDQLERRYVRELFDEPCAKVIPGAAARRVDAGTPRIRA